MDIDPTVMESLEPVIRDIDAAGVLVTTIRPYKWTDDPNIGSVQLVNPTSRNAGLVSVNLSKPQSERIACAADQAQEWLIEENLWGKHPTNWPACPRHPDTHPLKASWDTGQPMWTCPVDGVPMFRIGSVERRGHSD